MLPERSSWKEVGRKRDCSTLAGRMYVNGKPASWREAQKSTGFTTFQNGMKSGGRFGALQKMGTKGENVAERVEVAKRYSRASSQ